MNCSHCKELLAIFVEGLLAEPEKGAVTSHVKSCPDCMAELKEVIALHNRLVRNGQALKQTNLEDNVMNQIIRIQNAKLKKASVSATESLAVRRNIMKSPLIKFAAAAVVVIGVLLALQIVGPGNVVNAEDILRRIEKIPAFMYRMKMNIEDMSAVPEGRIDGLEMQAYISMDIGVRMDAYLKDELISKSYIDLKEQAIYSLIPKEKKYIRMNLTDELLEKMQEDNGDPRAMLEDFMEYETTQLGKSIIDGIEVKGIESHDPNIAEGVLGNAVGRIWVSTKDELPVKMEIEVFSQDGQDRVMDITIDRFQWDVDIPETEFAVNLEGYEMLAEVNMAVGVENVVDGLGAFVELSGGSYPSEMTPMKVVQELQNHLIAAWGGNPESEPGKEFLQRVMNLQTGAMMFGGLKKDGKDPAYYGNIVTTEFPHAVLMRWQTDDDAGKYNVILGDLTVKIVTTEELKKLESAPLNPKPTAVSPGPADGTDGTNLTGVKLTWIPGAYATAHKLYFGTDAANLALLGEVTLEEAEPGELERGVTYYWRIDEVQADGSTAKGDTWSFSTGSLAAHWKLDEGSGTTVSDSSGNGHDGVLIGDTAWIDGHIGGALVFDGNEDFVEIADSNDWNIVNQITVSAWIKVDAFDKQWQAIVSKGDRSWRLQRNSGEKSLEFACSGLIIPGNRWGAVHGKAGIVDGQWHHAAGVYNGEEISLYIDGKLDVSAQASGKIRVNDKGVLIGENSEKRGRFWIGAIDDVRIYSYGMTAQEVAALSKQ